jgi:hypothetical protein
MKLKTVEVSGVTYAEIKDGKPVYVHPDGKEVAMDVADLAGKVTFLTAESEKAFARRDEAMKALKAFEGIDDAEAARKALQTIANIDAKKLIDAGEVERVKAEIGKSYEGKLTEAQTRTQQLEQQLYGEKIGGSFSRSKLIADKLAIPADMVQARFGQAFKIEDGKTVAYDAHGNKIYSRARPGELADFDEALESLIETYPYKDHILKSSGASGGGAQGGSGTPSGRDLSNLSPTERLTAARAGKK